MNAEDLAASNIVFRVVRQMKWHGFTDLDSYIAYVEVVDNHGNRPANTPF